MVEQERRIEQRREQDRHCAFCEEPGTFKEKIIKVEENVEKLWDKWDGVQKLLIGILISSIFSLVTIVGGMLIFFVRSAGAQ